MNTLLETLNYFSFIFLELVFLFLSISTLVALGLQYIPQENFSRYLSGRGGYFLAAGLGSITPFCACSTIPLTQGLLNAGVGIGQILTFVLVSPLLNPIIVAMICSMMGGKAGAIYFGVCFGTAIVGGWLMSVFHAERDVRHREYRQNLTPKSCGAPPAASCGGDDNPPKKSVLPFREKIQKAFSSAYRDLQNVLIYLIIGTAIGAMIYGYIPQDWVIKLAGKDNIFAIPIAALIGVPLYIRAESAIPIGMALAEKGMSSGAVIALIIGGAGMAIPEISMLLSIFKLRIVAAVVALIFSTAVIGGYLFNWLV